MATRPVSKEEDYGKLDPAFKRRWVRRLLSGKDRQTRGQLRREVSGGKWGYCCLGVACNVYDPKRWESHEYRYSTRKDKHGYCRGIEDTSVPERLAKKIRLTERASVFLVRANDDYHWSLKRIGKWIQKNL